MRPLLFMVAVTALVACGGGGGSGPGAPAIVATPTSAPAAAPTAAATVVPLNGTAGFPQTIALPVVGGYSASVVLTPASPVNGAAAAFTVGTSVPNGAPAPTDSDLPLLYVGVTPSSDVALAGTPAFSVTLPSDVLQSVLRSAAASPYAIFLDFFDTKNPGNGYQAGGGGCAISGTTVTCTGGFSLLALLANVLYVFELKRHPIPATPSPGPTTSTGGPSASPGAATFNAPGQSQAVAVSEAGYTGSFSAASSNAAIASVTPATGTAFTIVAGTTAGFATVTLTDPQGRSAVIPVTVTITTGSF
jgi:hypothetical protein